MGHLLPLQIQDTCGGKRIYSSVSGVVIQGPMRLKACLIRLSNGNGFAFALKAFCSN